MKITEVYKILKENIKIFEQVEKIEIKNGILYIKKNKEWQSYYPDGSICKGVAAEELTVDLMRKALEKLDANR